MEFQSSEMENELREIACDWFLNSSCDSNVADT